MTRVGRWRKYETRVVGARPLGAEGGRAALEASDLAEGEAAGREAGVAAHREACPIQRRCNRNWR